MSTVNQQRSTNMLLRSSEKSLREIRRKIFDYSEEKEAQADRVLRYLKLRVLRSRNNKTLPTGTYSGLTRGELARSGTCEPDWF